MNWRQKPICACIFLLPIASAGCESETIPGGSITIRNDIMDDDYNEVVIDQVSAKTGMTPFRKRLRPGEEIGLPYKGITKIRFSRDYPGYTNVYVVECPSTLDKRVTMKLIDVHLNRLSGGCVLRKKGKKVDGYTTWE